MKQKVKSCPLCQNKNVEVVHDLDDSWFVYCSPCWNKDVDEGLGPLARTHDTAIKRWNQIPSKKKR